MFLGNAFAMKLRNTTHGRHPMQAAIVAATVACVLGTSSCAQDFQSPSEAVTDGAATSVELDPSNASVFPTETVQFAAAIVDQAGEPAAGQIDWTATGGAITADGLYTAGQTPGSYNVTATEANTGVSGSAGVTITDPGGGGGRISGVSWACNSLITDASGSDLWPVTWSDDDHQYTAWGDGNGFNGTSRFGYGIARLEGSAPSYSAIDVGEFSPGGGGGKVAGIISIGGTLYMWRSNQDGSPPTHSLIKSADKGQSVQATSVVFPMAGASSMTPATLVNMGRDYADAIDGYVYSVAGDWLTPSPSYLIRVPVTSIENPAAYEVFSGTPTNPSWNSNLSARQPIYTDPAASAANGAVHVVITYIAPLDRFILTAHHADDVGKWSIHDGPYPWGPWTEIARFSNWCGLGEQLAEMLPIYIAPKWISPNGTDFWIVFSGTGQWDRFNTIKGTFQLQ